MQYISLPEKPFYPQNWYGTKKFPDNKRTVLLIVDNYPHGNERTIGNYVPENDTWITADFKSNKQLRVLYWAEFPDFNPHKGGYNN